MVAQARHHQKKSQTDSENQPLRRVLETKFLGVVLVCWKTQTSSSIEEDLLALLLFIADDNAAAAVEVLASSSFSTCVLTTVHVCSPHSRLTEITARVLLG